MLHMANYGCNIFQFEGLSIAIKKHLAHAYLWIYQTTVFSERLHNRLIFWCVCIIPRTQARTHTNRIKLNHKNLPKKKINKKSHVFLFSNLCLCHNLFTKSGSTKFFIFDRWIDQSINRFNSLNSNIKRKYYGKMLGSFQISNVLCVKFIGCLFVRLCFFVRCDRFDHFELAYFIIQCAFRFFFSIHRNHDLA